MRLFSRNKSQPSAPQQQHHQQQQQQQQSPGVPSSQPPGPASSAPGASMPAPMPSPLPKPAAGSGAPVHHPGSYLSVNAPQPQPSPAQYHQMLFRQFYPYYLSHPLPQTAQGPGIPAHPGHPGINEADANAGAANATGAASIAGAGAGAGGGDSSAALLHEAVQRAAKAGKPLALNFVAQMQPIMANNPYGIRMPHAHPYGLPFNPNIPGPGPPLGWHPGMGQDPNESIKIPALPDMRNIPAELQDFREQCATGIRQAVAMITAMEHQLWWERSRRQQAEEDCKVLLAAVHTERGLGKTMQAAEEQRRREAAAAAGKLTLAADELAQASEAAKTIQKHVRGRLARKEFESHLRDILRGVDPALDPAALPVAAQSHISNVNATGAPRRIGLRSLMDDVINRSPQEGGAGAGSPRDQAEAVSYSRRQVERIEQRLASHRDAGEPHPGDASGDPLLADVKQLLSGSYPASTAQVIGALVRRCRELQAALLEATGQLEEAELTIQGLKDANAKLSELSTVRSDLEASRNDNLRLAGTVAKLRSVLTAQALASNAGAARENPFIAAWYRKAYADKEWQRVAPGGPGGVALMDGPDTAVETWDDLRASIPEPVMVPRVSVPGNQYKDLLGLKQDMIMSAAQGAPNPLYSMPVPDRSGFMYERDTPLMAMQSGAPLVRETLPPDTFLGVHDDINRRTPRRSGPSGGGGAMYVDRSDAGGANLLPSSAINIPGRATGPDGPYQQLLEQQERMRQQAAFEAARSMAGAGGGSGGAGSFRCNKDTPVIPVYSVLPLIREDEYIRRSTSPPPQTPPPSTPQRQTSFLQPQPQPRLQPHLQPYAQPQLQPYAQLQQQVQAYARPPQQPQPQLQPYAQPPQQPQTQAIYTNLHLIRDTVPPQPPPEVVAAAAAALTMPQSVAGSAPQGPRTGM